MSTLNVGTYTFGENRDDPTFDRNNPTHVKMRRFHENKAAIQKRFEEERDAMIRRHRQELVELGQKYDPIFRANAQEAGFR
jgi:hypothetical protein